MNYLFEEINVLTSPYEAFSCDTNLGGFPIKAHWHYYMEIILILEGTAIINCNSEEYILEPGDLILFHPQAVHSIFTSSPEPLKYEVIKFDINNLHINSSYTPKLSAIFKHSMEDTNAPIYLPSQTFESSSFLSIF